MKNIGYSVFLNVVKENKKDFKEGFLREGMEKEKAKQRVKELVKEFLEYSKNEINVVENSLK